MVVSTEKVWSPGISHVKYQSSGTHCSKDISKVKVSERRTEWQNDGMTEWTKTICPPTFDGNKKKQMKQETHGPHRSPVEEMKFAKWFWRRFSNILNIILLFCYYLPLEKGVALLWTNLNPLHPRMLYAKFGWNWPSDSGEDENVDDNNNRQWTKCNQKSLL